MLAFDHQSTLSLKIRQLIHFLHSLLLPHFLFCFQQHQTQTPRPVHTMLSTTPKFTSLLFTPPCQAARIQDQLVIWSGKSRLAGQGRGTTATSCRQERGEDCCPEHRQHPSRYPRQARAACREAPGSKGHRPQTRRPQPLRGSGVRSEDGTVRECPQVNLCREEENRKERQQNWQVCGHEEHIIK